MTTAQSPLNARLPHLLRSFAYRDFRFLWVTTFLSSAARNMQQVSLAWLAFHLTGSSLLLGTVLFFYQLPFLGPALVIGVWADRVDRRRLLAASQVALAVTALLLAADIVLGWVRTWHLIAFALLSGTENVVNHIVRQTLVPRVVPPPFMVNANSLNNIAFNITRIVGAAVGGLLIVTFSVAGNFAIQAVLLVGVAIAVMPIRVTVAPSDAQAAGHPLRRLAGQLGEGILYLWRSRQVRNVILLQFLFNGLAAPFINFLPVFTDHVLQSDARVLGLLTAASGAGSMVGALLMAQFGHARRRGQFLLLAIAANGVGLALLAAATALPAAIAVLVYLGGVQMIVYPLTATLVQTAVPDRLQGRVMAIYNLGNGATALGSLFMGMAIERLGVGTGFAVMGVALLAVSAAAFVLMPSLRVPQDA